MTAFVLLALLALTGIAGTVRLVSTDGYRRTPDRCDGAGATADPR